MTVQRHLGADGRAAVYVSTAGGNAVVGRDFQAISNYSLIWQDGDDLDKQLYVRVLNDAVPQETSKSFTLFLHDANGATLNTERNQTQVVLVPPSNLVSGSFRLLSSSVVAQESSSSVFEIAVLWEGGTTSSARLAYQTVCGSACDPSDFEVVSPPLLTWTRGGNTTQLIRINVKDDGIYEQNETFRVVLLSPGDLDAPPVEPVKDPSSVFTLPAATLGSISSVQVTILGPNNVVGGVAQFEAACFPACAATSYSVMDGGLVRAYIQRRSGSDGSLQARVVSVDGSARAGVDFRFVNVTVQWNEGEVATQFVLVEMITGVVRTTAVQFQLKLVDLQARSGGISVPALASDVASTTTVTIQGPSNIVLSEVTFVHPNPLQSVLRTPDETFFPMVTRFDSGIRVCPRVVVRHAGDLTLSLRRFFGTIASGASGATSVTVTTTDGTAVAGVDYTALSLETGTLTWKVTDIDAAVKSLTIAILEPPAYSTDRRSFFVEIASVSGVALGLCNTIEVVVDAISRPPHVTTFDLNMDAGVLTLRLTNPVLLATLDASAFTLQSDKSAGFSSAAKAAFESFQLSRHSTTASGDGTTIVITLSASDLNAVKRSKRLAKDAATTFLSAAPGAFDYVLESCSGSGFAACAHAKFEGIAATSAIPVVALTPDTTPPVLLRFTMDLGLQLVKLRFSEPVNGARVRLHSLGFSETPDAVDLRYLSPSSSQRFRPTPNPLNGVLQGDANPLPADETYVTIRLGATDLASLRSVGSGQIGLQAALTFVTLHADFVEDFASPPNAVVAIEPSPTTPLLRVAAADCSPCPANTFASSSCSDLNDRVCSACSVCPTNSYALAACSPVQDTVCYPCTDCIGGRFTATECSPTADRVCAACTRCSSDEYEASPCARQQDRVCRTCDSCSLTKDQQRLCSGSKRWKRLQMKAPYGCPLADQTYQTLEARLQRGKSNRCGAGRCSCTGNGVGNANPNGDSFPNDWRCTGPEVFNID